MNALYGLLHLKGAPVEAVYLARMARAIAWRPNDAAVGWHAGPVALGCLIQEHRAGRMRQQPVWDERTGIGLIAASRLINRQELTGQLAPRLPVPADPTDADLIRAAWQVWGHECVRRLEGDWHFALWGRGARGLFLARSPAGCSSLYTRQVGDYFLFASTQKPLLALPGVTDRPNLARIVEIVATGEGAGAETAYADVLRLPPAHWLSVDEEGIRRQRYWFPEDQAEERLANDDEYAERLRFLFCRAVERRLSSRGAVGVFLSSGLDSGGVAALAAPALAIQGHRLAAFVAVPIGPPAAGLAGHGPTDEGALAGCVAEHVGNMDLHRVTAATVSPLAGIERALQVHDEPSHPAANSYWLWAGHQAAQAHDVRLLLTGTAGNNTLSWTGVLPDLLSPLRRGAWGEAQATLAQLQARSGAGLGRLLLHGLARPLARALRDRARDGWQALRSPNGLDDSPVSPLRGEWVRAQGLAGVYADDHHDDSDTSAAARRLHWRSFGPGASTLGARQYQESWAGGFDLLDPTADRALVEFCATVPVAQFHNGVQDRWLMRRALAGLLPDAVRLQRKRGRQAADLGFRVAANQAELAAALAYLRRHALAAELLDLARMEQVLAHAAANPVTVSHRECGLLLLRGVMIGLFLCRF